MPETFWTAFFGFLVTALTLVLGYMSRQQAAQARRSLENSNKLDSIEEKVNGHLEARVREARWQANPQILLVDDNQNDLELMAKELNRFGSDVFFARNALEATKLIHQRIGSGRGLPFDLVLVDLRLVASSAAEVIEMLLREAPWVRVVIITGGLIPELITPIMQRRATTILGKPLDSAKIEDLFRQFGIPFFAPTNARP